MAGSINSVTLLGRLGKDPVVRRTKADLAVATLAVATNHFTKNKGDITEWHDVTVFGNKAEACGSALTKGSQVAVEGRITTNKYRNDNGQDVYRTSIVANDVHFVGGKGANNNAGNNSGLINEPLPLDGIAEVPF